MHIETTIELKDDRNQLDRQNTPLERLKDSQFIGSVCFVLTSISAIFPVANL